MSLIRGLDILIADLDSRQRPSNPSKNRPLLAYLSVGDTVGQGQDTQTVVSQVTPMLWASSTTLPPNSGELAWSLGEWAG